MANNPSALKRVRQIQTRTARNRVIKTKVKNLRKGLDTAAESGDEKAISEAFARYSSAVDRAVKNNIFHRNKGANLKSKASASIKAAAAQ
ncbi:30S ribosomal protein S20 [Roseibacillus ishigakijimensis]|uniref:Small ribosomal subunit protein bS20 n=1 Tax=Roseibacillus ishigakijimensis TaxID=454146 RepID=A0A934RM48_9BACT|nr:30S ribosomal protein S20 [Roseibacillus ishigakijimensis]MBK1834307.1 30S ribosomal protein S20 [Roseibacillus ishigakijimensis]